jgi:hypothetical protein
MIFLPIDVPFIHFRLRDSADRHSFKSINMPKAATRKSGGKVEKKRAKKGKHHLQAGAARSRAATASFAASRG